MITVEYPQEAIELLSPDESMSVARYQSEAAKTLLWPKNGEAKGLEDHEYSLVAAALGLAGEVGEVVEKIKKGIFFRHGLDIPAISAELGDVLWYVAAICTLLGRDMGVVMEENIVKIRARHGEEFTYSGTHHD